jgi:hypothetical protein
MRQRSASKDPKDEPPSRSSRRKQGSDIPSRQLTVVVSKIQPLDLSATISADSSSSPQVSLLKSKQLHRWYELQEHEVDMLRIAKEYPGKIGVSDDGKRKFTLDITSLDPELIKRQEILHELIQTERDYLNDLKMVANLFISKMGEKGILSAIDLQKVFANWMSLIPIHEAFLTSLERRKRNGMGFVKNVSGVVCDLGLMLGLAYETYCVNHPTAMAFLETTERNEKLHVYLQVSFL